jgi:hypothetical protein
MDPHSFGCPGSGSVLGMRIRIQEHENLPKFTNKPGFLPFKKAFEKAFVGMFFYLLPNRIYITNISHVKFNFL